MIIIIDGAGFVDEESLAILSQIVSKRSSCVQEKIVLWNVGNRDLWKMIVDELMQDGHWKNQQSRNFMKEHVTY